MLFLDAASLPQHADCFCGAMLVAFLELIRLPPWAIGRKIVLCTRSMLLAWRFLGSGYGNWCGKWHTFHLKFCYNQNDGALRLTTAVRYQTGVKCRYRQSKLCLGHLKRQWQTTVTKMGVGSNGSCREGFSKTHPVTHTDSSSLFTVNGRPLPLWRHMAYKRFGPTKTQDTTYTPWPHAYGAVSYFPQLIVHCKNTP